MDVALDGTEGEWLATRERLRRPGPGRDAARASPGDELCARLREAGDWTPILMLTARAGAEQEARALDTGADDFLAKPFSFVVLLARLRALLRRGGGERPAVLARRRPAPGPGRAPGLARRDRRRADPAAVLAAGVPAAPRRRGGVEGDDPRPRLGLRLRRRPQHRRGVRAPAPPADRRAVRPGQPADGARWSATGSTRTAAEMRLRLTLRTRATVLRDRDHRTDPAARLGGR